MCSASSGINANFFRELLPDSSSYAVARLAKREGWRDEGGLEINIFSMEIIDYKREMYAQISKMARK